MSIVTYFVETSQTYLDSAAETQFGSVAATVGTLLVVATTLVVLLVFINMIFQYRAMDGRTAFWLAVKIGLIGIFATNWVQFNAFSSAILSGIDSIAGALVASVGGGSPGPSGTFAEEFDRLIAELGAYLNAAGSELNWMAGAMLRHRRCASALDPRRAGRLHPRGLPTDDRASYRDRPGDDLPDPVRGDQGLFRRAGSPRSSPSRSTRS